MIRITLIGLILLNATSVYANNLHKLDEDKNGYAIYRSGRPSEADFLEWCKLGITEVLVLSGTATEVEKKMQSLCPQISVISTEIQDAFRPLDTRFLTFFEHWVNEARIKGRKILFRCECGCHRTGRLAAYYEAKYLNYDREKIFINYEARSQYLPNIEALHRQIDALIDYAHKLPCRFRNPENISQYCPT